MDAALELNHVALLQYQAKHNGNTTLLRLPVQRGPEPCREWTTVTVAEFAADVDRVAIFLFAQMNARCIPPRSVVTLLYADTLIQYQDLVYAIALARASYIPQMCSDMLTHPEIIFGLMEQANSKMIIYDPSLEHLTKGCPFPKLEFHALNSIKSCPRRDNISSLPAVDTLPSGSDLSFVFLTSGSTSGSPKVVPLTQTVFSIFYKIQIERWLDGERHDTQDVFLAPGNFVCHIPSMIQYLGCLLTGSCLVQPSKPRFSAEELSNLVKVCGLNRFTTYGTFLAPYIQKAKKDPAILKLLQDMRTVSYLGVPISSDDDDWCFEKGIPATNMYGATEIGLVMSTIPGKPARFLRPEPGVLCRFEPVTDAVIHDNLGSTTRLVEFVLLADSPQIPQPHLRSADGNLHTGDLFEEQLDGSFRFRGRDDDWIKSFEADRIDARAIEAKINDTSSDLVKECVVVGHLRPSPALFVAVRREESGNTTDSEIKDTILRRLEDFNARQYVHERITDKRLVFIVDEGVLPRTKKGNFRRRATEQKYQEELDVMYMSVYGY